MPYGIQRVPNGLLNLLGLNGGRTPELLADQVLGVIDLLQMYGQSQRRTADATAVVAFGGDVTITPSLTQWSVLFGMDGQAALTATATAMGIAVGMRRGGPGVVAQMYAYAEALTPTVIPGLLHCVYAPSMPVLLAPGTVLLVRNQRLGVDANVSLALTADFGVLG